MSNVLTIQAEARNDLGSAHSRRLRKAEQVPAVIYGHGGPGCAVIVKAADLGSLVHHAGLVSLEMAGGEAKSAIVKEVQTHPIQDRVLHIDFQEVKAGEKIHSQVRIESIGIPAGAPFGGQLEQILHELEIRCLPGEMVEVITVDVSAMKVDDTMHVGDLILPTGAEVMVDAEIPVFQVRLPRIEEVEEEEVTEEATVTPTKE